MVAIPGGKVCVLLGKLSHCHVYLGWGWCQDDLLPGGPQAPSVRDIGNQERRSSGDEHWKPVFPGYRRCANASCPDM